MTVKSEQAKEKVITAVKALDEKKAIDICAFEISKLSSISDFIVCATATSSTHIRALADNVEKRLTEQGTEPHHTEGKATGWFLLDYTDFLVNIFTKDAREFYNLEKLWADGEELDLNEVLKDDKDGKDGKDGTKGE